MQIEFLLRLDHVCSTLWMVTRVDLSEWLAIIGRLEALVDLEATAREFGASQRVRKVRHASDLLKLAMMYGLGLLSLRGTAAVAVAADGDVVSLTETWPCSFNSLLGQVAE